MVRPQHAAFGLDQFAIKVFRFRIALLRTQRVRQARADDKYLGMIGTIRALVNLERGPKRRLRIGLLFLIIKVPSQIVESCRRQLVFGSELSLGRFQYLSIQLFRFGVTPLVSEDHGQLLRGAQGVAILGTEFAMAGIHRLTAQLLRLGVPALRIEGAGEIVLRLQCGRVTGPSALRRISAARRNRDSAFE